MIKVDYTHELIEGEPGPNLYFMGKPDDFRLLIEPIRDLIDEKKNKISLSNLVFIELLEPLKDVLFCINERDEHLAKVINSNEIEVSLSRSLWLKIHEMANVLSRKKGHLYIEFDDLNLREDCNIIWSSEW